MNTTLIIVKQATQHDTSASCLFVTATWMSYVKCTNYTIIIKWSMSIGRKFTSHINVPNKTTLPKWRRWWLNTESAPLKRRHDRSKESLPMIYDEIAATLVAVSLMMMRMILNVFHYMNYVSVCHQKIDQAFAAVAVFRPRRMRFLDDHHHHVNLSVANYHHCHRQYKWRR